MFISMHAEHASASNYSAQSRQRDLYPSRTPRSRLIAPSTASLGAVRLRCRRGASAPKAPCPISARSKSTRDYPVYADIGDAAMLIKHHRDRITPELR